MSLDLYIVSKTPVLHRSTGVYIRENGEARELENKEEVLKHFPDINPNNIKEISYIDNKYFHINITHNLTEMADKCCVSLCNNNSVSLYQLMWHPEDSLGIITPTMDYVTELISCCKMLGENADLFKRYNPDNGWGNYEQLLGKTKEFIAALIKISDNFENYTIIADT